LLVGPTGCGKTLAAQSVADVYAEDSSFFYFNLGSTQDARSSLIGNTNFNKESGTIFNESTFVTAIRKTGSIILLDEISRAHPDAWNILMSVLDPIQRYLRLDEKRDSEVVKVADRVTFLATANVGNEYTSTKIMDRALMNRFSVKIEMNPLDKENELKFLLDKFGISDPTEISILTSLVEIADHTRKSVKQEDTCLSNFLSTRDSVEMAELVIDGFSLTEIAENVIYPNFTSDGGTESERTYIKQLVQKYVVDTSLPSQLFDKKDIKTPKSDVPF
jgi:MoxR-like ATPase